jgi:hypothetical protein
MYDKPRPDLFKKFLVKEADLQPPSDSLQEKVLKAYIRMKAKAMKRKERQISGRTLWDPQIGDLVLAKCQPTSNAATGITSKFVRPYDGPWRIYKLIPPATYEISDLNGKT